MAAAKIDHVGFNRGNFGHQRVKVFFTARQPFIQHLFHAALVHFRPGGIRQPLAVGVLVVDHRDALGLQGIQHVIGGDHPLLIVTPAHAEHVGHAALGDLRVGRARGDGDNTGFVIHLGGRHGGG
ncbi:hypothetical protein D3C71_1817510 [compost metagenome]